MTQPMRVLGAGFLLLACGTTFQAQAPQTPAEPGTPPRAQIGPVAIRPTLIVREVGYDSNVLNESGDEQGDFTATLGARLELGLKTPRVQGTYATFYEYSVFL